jgi:hypothetical protein
LVLGVQVRPTAVIPQLLEREYLLMLRAVVAEQMLRAHLQLLEDVVVELQTLEVLPLEQALREEMEVVLVQLLLFSTFWLLGVEV